MSRFVAPRTSVKFTPSAETLNIFTACVSITKHQKNNQVVISLADEKRLIDF